MQEVKRPYYLNDCPFCVKGVFYQNLIKCKVCRSRYNKEITESHTEEFKKEMRDYEKLRYAARSEETIEAQRIRSREYYREMKPSKKAELNKKVRERARANK